jgi:hypothetical protein
MHQAELSNQNAVCITDFLLHVVFIVEVVQLPQVQKKVALVKEKRRDCSNRSHASPC